MLVYENMTARHCTKKTSEYLEINEESKKWCSLQLSWLHTTTVTRLIAKFPPKFCVFGAFSYFFCSFWTNFATAH